MRMRDKLAAPSVLALTALLALGTAAAAGPRNALRQAIAVQGGNKALEVDGKPWSPTAGRPGLNADVAEVEPNDLLAQAQAFSCGDNFRPAAINVPDDFDLLVITASTGDRLTFGTDDDGVSGQVGDTVIGIFDASGTLLEADDDSGPGLYSLIADFSAPYTGTYYLGILAWDPIGTGGYQAFLRCAPAGPPPVNDTCNGATLLPCTQVNLAGTTVGAANDYTPTAAGPGCTGYAEDGADIVYLVTLQPGGSLSLDYTSEADGAIYLLDTCVSPAEAACVAGADANFSGAPEHLAYTNVGATNQTYYLVLDSFGTNTGGTFTLTGTVDCPPVAVEGVSWGTLKARFGR